jgi:Protein of unknown function (DUF3574)
LKALLAALSVFLVAGCAALRPSPACAPGQERLRTAQLFLGHADGPIIPEADLRRFVETSVRPKFPGGLTILEGGAQWRGRENRDLRDSALVVSLVLPNADDAKSRLDAVRDAYAARFKQPLPLTVAKPTCLAF